MSIIRVGISGWTFAPWRGAFYPRGLPSAQELAYAAGQFRTLEVTASFYAQPRREAFRTWAEQVPAPFLFTVKAPRQITHVRRLRDFDGALAAFCASGVLHLGPHLGPILWQLPANLAFDAARMDTFLTRLPRTTEEAERLARGQGWPARTRGMEAVAPRPLRHAIDVRHATFHSREFIDLLRVHEVALVCDDAAGRPCWMDLTSDFVYCRLGGPAKGDYDAAALETWLARSRLWIEGGEPAQATRIGGKGRPRKRDVFLIFDTADRLRAPVHALELMRRLRG